MADIQESAPSSCKSCHDSATENQEKDTPVSGRLARAGFSDSFSSHDMGLEVEAAESTAEASEEAKHDGAIGVSSPRGIPEDCSTNSGSENTSTSNRVESETGTSGSEEQSNSANTLHWRDLISVFKKGPSMRKQSFPHLKKGVPRLTRRKSRKIREDMVPALGCIDADFCYLKPSWKNYSLSEIQAATDNFSHDNLIGQGGYAEVYKGKLQDGQLVAIKRLTRGSTEEMTVDFLSELGIIVHVDHPNIAKLVGYGVEGGMHLVLELSAHGSLASLLYGPKEMLDWGKRFKIALGSANGLLYLHEGCQRRIIHKDIKASNILLTEDFEPQISDFGLAKWLPEQWTHHTVSKVEGTFGYLPPEFFMHGIVDEKTDVYAYGVLLLELITGRQALDSSQHSLVMWAKPLLMKNNIDELVDPTLANAYDSEQMNLVILTASMCINPSSMQRPQMRQASVNIAESKQNFADFIMMTRIVSKQVVKILKGEDSCIEEVKLNQDSEMQRTDSEEFYDAEEYNSTKYLNDLNRHMEVVLGQCDETSEQSSSDLHSVDDDVNQQVQLALGQSKS